MVFQSGVCSAHHSNMSTMIFSAGSDGIDPRVLRHVFLEDVVLHRAAQLRDRHALPLRRGDVEAEQNRRRAVDRHRRGHLIERNAREQRFHVGQARDRDPALADLSLGARMIGVVSHQRGEVERHRQPGLPALEQEFVAPVGVLGRAEPGELAHRPEPAPVHRGMDAARERIRAGGAQLRLRTPPLQILRRVHRLPLDAHRVAPVLA